MASGLKSGSKTAGEEVRAAGRCVQERERILAVAREVFREQGLSGSLQEVARRTGVGIGTVYNRFGRPGQLIDAVYLDAVQRQLESTERAWAISDPWQALIELLTDMAETMVTDKGFTTSVSQGMSGITDGTDETTWPRARRCSYPARQGIWTYYAATWVWQMFFLAGVVDGSGNGTYPGRTAGSVGSCTWLSSSTGCRRRTHICSRALGLTADAIRQIVVQGGDAMA